MLKISQLDWEGNPEDWREQISESDEAALTNEEQMELFSKERNMQLTSMIHYNNVSQLCIAKLEKWAEAEEFSGLLEQELTERARRTQNSVPEGEGV